MPEKISPGGGGWGQRFALALLAWLLLLSVVGLHGFSLPAYHEHLEQNRGAETLIGGPRGERVDDWGAWLPLIFSQRQPRVDYGPTNPLIGPEGQSTTIAFPVPIKHWLSFFRPQLWGYFVGENFGMAWHWHFRIALLFFSSTMFLLWMGVPTRGMALLASLLLINSPFFQFWAYNYEPMLSAFLLALLCVAQLAQSRGLVAQLAASAGLFWAGGVFLFSGLYPPYLVSLCWLGVALALGLAPRWYQSLPRPAAWKTRLLWVAAAVVGVGVFAFTYLRGHQALIEKVFATEYPGRRFTPGGAFGWGQWLSGIYLSVPSVARSAAGYFGNRCEGASFLMTWPLVMAALAVSAWRRRRWPGPLALALMAYLIFLSLWAVVGLPAPFRSWLLLDRVPEARAFFAQGVADWLLLGYWLSQKDELSRRDRHGLLAAWVFLLLLLAWLTHRQVTPLVWPRLVLVLILLPWAGNLLLRRRKWGLGILLFCVAATTSWYNPVVFRGYEYLQDNPVSQAMKKWGGPDARWLVGPDFLEANLPKILGQVGLGGLYFYPQDRLWQVLDPSGASRKEWNRYGYVQVDFVPPEKPRRIRALQLDVISVELPVDDPALSDLGVTHILSTDPAQSELLRHSRLFERVWSKNRSSIFVRRPQ